MIHDIRVTKLKIMMMDWPGPDYMFAESCGIMAQHFSEYMMGRRTLPIRQAMKIARLLECEPGQLIGWAGEETFVALDGEVLM